MVSLRVGDEITNTKGKTRTVLAVLGELVAISRSNQPHRFAEWYTLDELLELKFYLVGEH